MITAQTLSLQLGGRWYGYYGCAPCPICQPERRKDQNALTISQGTNFLLFHCNKRGCNFKDIRAAAGVKRDLPQLQSSGNILPLNVQNQLGITRRELQATNLWSEAIPIQSTLAEVYLRQRGITCKLPNTLRFHADCWHPNAKRLPAMIATIEGAESFAVHRTYLQSDGLDKAKVNPAKAMLGKVKGGAVHIKDYDGPLYVTEGIENALSLASGLLNEQIRIWAALSTSGIKSLKLPARKNKLIIATDNDTAGNEAANNLGIKASVIGWNVSLLTPPKGKDWNDIIRGIK